MGAAAVCLLGGAQVGELTPSREQDFEQRACDCASLPSPTGLHATVRVTDDLRPGYRSVTLRRGPRFSGVARACCWTCESRFRQGLEPPQRADRYRGGLGRRHRRSIQSVRHDVRVLDP